MANEKFNFVVCSVQTAYNGCVAHDKVVCSNVEILVDALRNRQMRQVVISFLWSEYATTIKMNDYTSCCYGGRIMQLSSAVGAQAIAEWFFENTTMLGKLVVDQYSDLERVLMLFCKTENIDYDRLRAGGMVRQELLH